MSEAREILERCAKDKEERAKELDFKFKRRVEILKRFKATCENGRCCVTCETCGAQIVVDRNGNLWSTYRSCLTIQGIISKLAQNGLM